MYHIAFPQKSNRESWVFVGLITDLNDNPIDISGCSLVFQIRPSRRNEGREYYYPGGADTGLIASTDNGKLVISGYGQFQWVFTLQDMRTLRPGTYDTGLTLTSRDGVQTMQLGVGPLPIIDGVVP